MKNLIKHSAGDTIVEVLISIVVFSVILTGAYVTSNNSFKSILNAQERVQALGFAQNQIEDLRSQASTVFGGVSNLAYLDTPNKTFCFDSSNTFQTNPSALCALGGVADGNRYNVAIQGLGETSPLASPPITTYGFEVTVTWAGLSPYSSTNHLNLYYRVSI